jgi:hypothetical protein
MSKASLSFTQPEHLIDFVINKIEFMSKTKECNFSVYGIVGSERNRNYHQLSSSDGRYNYE